MSRKNFKVATTEDGKTTIIKIDKTPTGKVKTLKDREKIKKEREEQYQNFRIAALKRRAKRIGLSEEDIKKKVEELKNQLDTPNSYDVLLFFHPDNAGLIKEALTKEGIMWKIMGGYKQCDSYAYVEADQETLGTLREILPPGTKIHPYVKKKPPIIPLHDFEKSRGNTRVNANGKWVSIKKHTKAEKKELAAKAKKARKAAKMAAYKNRKKKAGKAWNKVQKQIRLLAAKKNRKATTVQLKGKKGSTASKKASTDLKQAA
jgi:hypothetical protein